MLGVAIMLSGIIHLWQVMSDAEERSNFGDIRIWDILIKGTQPVLLTVRIIFNYKEP